jgi:hypothetical protein
MPRKGLGCFATTCSRASSHPNAGNPTRGRGLQALCATTLRFTFDLNTTTRECLGHRLAAGSRTLGALALHGRRGGNTALHSPPPTTLLRSLPYGHYLGGRHEPLPRAQTQTKRFGRFHRASSSCLNGVSFRLRVRFYPIRLLRALISPLRANAASATLSFDAVSTFSASQFH